MFSQNYKRKTERLLLNLREHIFHPPVLSNSSLSSSTTDSLRGEGDTEPLIPPRLYPNLENSSLVTVDIADQDSSDKKKLSQIENDIKKLKEQLNRVNLSETPNSNFSPPTNNDNRAPPLTSTGIPNPNFNFNTPPVHSSINPPNSQSVDVSSASSEGAVCLSKLSQQATLALTSIEPFSGESQSERNWADFKRQMSQILSLYVSQTPGITDQEFDKLKASCLKSRLTKAALRHAHNQPKSISNSYSNLIRALSERFAPPLNISQVTSELSSLQQKDLSITALEDKINSLVAKYEKVDKTLLEKSEEQKEAILENLKKQALHTSLRADIFAEIVKANKLSDYHSMLKSAKEIEGNLLILKARAEGNKQSRTTTIMKCDTESREDPKPNRQHNSYPRKHKFNPRNKPPVNQINFSEINPPGRQSYYPPRFLNNFHPNNYMNSPRHHGSYQPRYTPPFGNTHPNRFEYNRRSAPWHPHNQHQGTFFGPQNAVHPHNRSMPQSHP